MKRFLLLVLLVTGIVGGYAQKGGGSGPYLDSIKAFRANYIQGHELLTTPEQKALLRFYPLDAAYRVVARFERYADSPWFAMATSGKETQKQRKYGRLSFTLQGKTLHLMVYQSQALLQNATYRNYLLIAFTDLTSGVDSYGAGRYIDCTTDEIRNGRLVLDFNKAYNPYCAYATGYNCPIPPRENDLPVAIHAGEKNYGKAH